MNTVLAIGLMLAGLATAGEEGKTVDGRKEGLWQTTWEDGTLRSSGRYRYGLRDGLWEEWFDDGQLERRSTWVVGVPHGPVIVWDAEGTMRHERTYFFGEEHGTWRYWNADGDLRGMRSWRQGVLYGRAERGSTSAGPKVIEYYVSGALDGLHTRYNRRGREVRRVRYAQGERVEVLDVWRKRRRAAAKRTAALDASVS